MQITGIRNAVFANAEQTAVSCEIRIDDGDWLPFTASQNDFEQHGRDVFASVIESGHVGGFDSLSHGSVARVSSCYGIDIAADLARRRFVSPGDLIEKEYEVALQQAKDWLAAGMPDPVPSAVQSGVAASNSTLTAEQAARQIVDMAAAWEGVLMATREIRLTGKAAVNAAADDADFDAVAQPFLDQLEAIRPEAL